MSVSNSIFRRIRIARQGTVSSVVLLARELRARVLKREIPKDFSVSLCLCSKRLFYLSFRVVNANRANTNDAIQKRTMTFDSDHPISSK
jgi:hypothetical protein